MRRLWMIRAPSEVGRKQEEMRFRWAMSVLVRVRHKVWEVFKKFLGQGCHANGT